MQNVVVQVRGGDLEKAIRRLRKKVSNEQIASDIRRTEAYRRPGVKRYVKHQRVLARARKMEKMFAQ